MKQTVSFLLIGLLIVSALGSVPTGAESHSLALEKTLSFTPVSIEYRDDFAFISLAESEVSTHSEGSPSIPISTQIFVLPFGSTIQDVDVSYSDASVIHLESKVAPARGPMYISSDYAQDNSFEYVCDDEVYTHSALYPTKEISWNLGAGLQDGEEVMYLSVSTYPVRYNPVSDELVCFEHVEIDVSYEEPAEQISFADDYDLLIITPEQFSSELQRLVDFKTDNGIATLMTNLEDIPNDGVDIQESIKLYIKEVKETSGIDYVILVGAGYMEEGVEPLFPVRMAWVGSGAYEDYFPSDLYYADLYDSELNFPSWDYDGDGKYAELNQDEEAIDMYPDVYISRLPCMTSSDVKFVVNKIIRYATTNVMNNKLLQIGGDTFPTDGEGVLEGEFTNIAVMEGLTGYEPIRAWASDGTLTKLNIIKAVIQGVDFFDFSGHGSPSGFATHAPQDEHTWLPQSLFLPYDTFLYLNVYPMFNLNKYPVVVLNACSCNKFTVTKSCMGWTFVRHPFGGGIAAFGASGIGYGTPGSGEPDRLFGWFEVDLLDRLDEGLDLGTVWGESLSGYINEFSTEIDGGDLKTIYEMTLLGDCSLLIADA